LLQTRVKNFVDFQADLCFKNQEVSSRIGPKLVSEALEIFQSTAVIS